MFRRPRLVWLTFISVACVGCDTAPVVLTPDATDTIGDSAVSDADPQGCGDMYLNGVRELAPGQSIQVRAVYPPPGSTFHWSVYALPEHGDATLTGPGSYVTFSATVGGVYTLQLMTLDGVEPTCIEHIDIFVRPHPAIRVELAWTDAGTAPEGVDLDLHFVHPLASGDGYFDLPFDAFWDNDEPNWGSLDAAANDNCRLSNDANRSEQLGCPMLEHRADNGCYKLGVNVWNDRGASPAFATVKVFVREVLAYEVDAVRLDKYDMWTVAEICMPAAVDADPLVVPRCAATEGENACDDCGSGACSPAIQADYHNPDFAQP